MDINELDETIFEEIFWDSFNNECVNLAKDKTYKKCGDICSDIVSSNYKIQQFIENDVANSFDKSEVEKLVKYNIAHSKRSIIECKKMFYAGAKFMFYFLDNANMINKKIEPMKD